MKETLIGAERDRVRLMRRIPEEFLEVVSTTDREWFEIPDEETQGKIIAESHGNFHHNAKAMMAAIKKKNIIIPNVEKLCYNYKKQCFTCAGVSRKTTITPFLIVVPEYPLHHMYIDIAFLPKLKREIGIVNMIDHLTKFLWTKGIKNKKAETIAEFLEEVFDNIGIEKDSNNNCTIYLRSDNGGEFVNETVISKCNEYGVTLKQGPAYSPWVQGVIEKANKTIKDKLKKWMSETVSTNWISIIENVNEDYNNSWHSTINMSPRDAWKGCFSNKVDLSKLSDDQLAARTGLINQLRSNILKRMQSERIRLLKNKQVDYFNIGQVVLVRVPKRFRSTFDMLWGRKAQIVEEQTDVHGNSCFKWKVRWLETGGLSKAERPYTISNYFISSRDLKPFCFGNDSLVEFGFVEDVLEAVDYNDDDFEKEESYLLEDSIPSNDNVELFNDTSTDTEYAYLDINVDYDS